MWLSIEREDNQMFLYILIWMKLWRHFFLSFLVDEKKSITSFNGIGFSGRFLLLLRGVPSAIRKTKYNRKWLPSPNQRTNANNDLSGSHAKYHPICILARRRGWQRRPSGCIHLPPPTHHGSRQKKFLTITEPMNAASGIPGSKQIAKDLTAAGVRGFTLSAPDYFVPVLEGIHQGGWIQQLTGPTGNAIFLSWYLQKA